MTIFGWLLFGLAVCIAIIAWNGLANLMQWRQNKRMLEARWEPEPRVRVLARSKPYDQDDEAA